MRLEDLKEDARSMADWDQRRFIVLVALVISISLFLVTVAMNLYTTSGAIQLDLSRPSYQAVREEATRETATVSYPANGQLDAKSLEQFRKLYAEQSNKATSVTSFDEKAMSDDSLQLFSVPATQ